MYRYRNDSADSTIDLSPEALDRAMIRGRHLRSRAFHDMAIGLYEWLVAPKRPAVDIKSLHNGTTARPNHTVTN
ncbi:MAG: hypothetical protein O2985_05820 [Proteobacteria bacterium]|nr:hypothetical protein [Pseudomonadota bacterium]